VKVKTLPNMSKLVFAEPPVCILGVRARNRESRSGSSAVQVAHVSSLEVVVYI
jgi:hypothetical protein